MAKLLFMAVTDDTGKVDIEHSVNVRCVINDYDLRLSVRDFCDRFLVPSYTAIYRCLSEGNNPAILPHLEAPNYRGLLIPNVQPELIEDWKRDVDFILSEQWTPQQRAQKVSGEDEA